MIFNEDQQEHIVPHIISTMGWVFNFQIDHFGWVRARVWSQTYLDGWAEGRLPILTMYQGPMGVSTYPSGHMTLALRYSGLGLVPRLRLLLTLSLDVRSVGLIGAIIRIGFLHLSSGTNAEQPGS